MIKAQQGSDIPLTLLQSGRNSAFTSATAGPPKLIDLFCGAGGMTLGFVREGFSPMWANDFSEAATRTYRANFGDHCHSGDILQLLSDNCIEIPPADVVIGGPPCQGFSLLNKSRNGDERRHLWMPFLEVVRRSGASIFVMENVPQLLGSDEHRAIEECASHMGFTLASGKLLAADYGVPQTRTRAFIVGCKDHDPNLSFPPPKSHYNPKTGGTTLFESITGFAPWRTVRDAIADLEPPESVDIRNVQPPYNLHFGRTPTETSMLRYRAIPAEGMNREDLLRNAPELTPQCWIEKKGGTDLFGRLWWDRPAFTIRTEFFKPEKGRYLHPVQHRPITHREAARFQGFPDDFIFLGSKIEIARQIGNAVPPPLSAALARCVLDLLALPKEAAKVG